MPMTSGVTLRALFTVLGHRLSLSNPELAHLSNPQRAKFQSTPSSLKSGEIAQTNYHGDLNVNLCYDLV